MPIFGPYAISAPTHGKSVFFLFRIGSFGHRSGFHAATFLTQSVQGVSVAAHLLGIRGGFERHRHPSALKDPSGETGFNHDDEVNINHY